MAIIEVRPKITRNSVKRLFFGMRQMIMKLDCFGEMRNFVNLIKSERVIFDPDFIKVLSEVEKQKIALMLLLLNVEKAFVYTPSGVRIFYERGMYWDIPIFFDIDSLVTIIKVSKRAYVYSAILDDPTEANHIKETMKTRIPNEVDGDIIIREGKINRRRKWILNAEIEFIGKEWKKLAIRAFVAHLGKTTKEMHGWIRFIN